jgi:hypothetical protein
LTAFRFDVLRFALDASTPDETRLCRWTRPNQGYRARFEYSLWVVGLPSPFTIVSTRDTNSCRGN